MTLTEPQLHFLSEIATVAATEAGKLVQSYSDNIPKVEIKEGGDGMASQVVTEVDRKSQELILQHLQPTCEKYDLGILAEEDYDDGSRFTKDYFWCIDPLDGTWPYTEQVSGYSISIALVTQSGEAVIGVVYDPVTTNLYQAIQGQGVKRNREPWSPIQQNDYLTFFVDRSFPKHTQFSKVCKALEEYAMNKGLQGLEVKENGGSVLTALYALENQPAVYFKFPKPTNGGGSIWDFAATACIYKEAGGYVSDIYGNSLKLNRGDGTTFMNHEGALYSYDESLKHLVISLYSRLVK